METIYSRYRTGSTSFDSTLRLLQELLTTRLLPQYSRIWVQGYSGKSMFVFTIFENGREDGRSYTMRFLTLGAFRQYRPSTSSDVFDKEVQLVEDFIIGLRSSVLNGVIS